jgi:hypothetical protein
VLAERWRIHYNTVRPHSSLGCQPPAPEPCHTKIKSGYGEVESNGRFPHPRRRRDTRCAKLTIQLAQRIGQIRSGSGHRLGMRAGDLLNRQASRFTSRFQPRTIAHLP